MTCIDVLFHVTDDLIHQKSFRNLCLHLKPGGILLIQEHLIEKEKVEKDLNIRKTHCRWRSKEHYLESLLSGVRLVDHKRYDLPAERKHKDILVFRADDRCTAAEGGGVAAI